MRLRLGRGPSLMSDSWSSVNYHSQPRCRRVKQQGANLDRRAAPTVQDPARGVVAKAVAKRSARSRSVDRRCALNLPLLIPDRGGGEGQRGSARTGEARELLLTHHGAVQLVDRLALAGYMARTASADDRCKVELGLTDAGRLTLDALAELHLTEILRQEPQLAHSLRKLRKDSTLGKR